MSKKAPAWLEETREFCRKSGIKIMAWGPDMVTVEAKSEDCAKQIASQLGQLGFKVVENADNAHAGMLDLSKNPAAIQARVASFDISRRRWDEQILPLIWAFFSLALVPGHSGRTPYWFRLLLGLFSLVMFFWDGARIWSWRLEILPEGLRVRRYYRWTTIPWRQIQTVASVDDGRSQEAVVLKLKSSATERLGSFNFAFARNLRDRLRIEITERGEHI